MTRPVLPLLEYVANKDYIAEVLCVNKEKVQLNCQGKCYLMQQLRAQENDKNPEIPKVSLEEYPIGFVTLTSFRPIQKRKITSRIQIEHLKLYSFLYNKNTLKPPIHLT